MNTTERKANKQNKRRDEKTVLYSVFLPPPSNALHHAGQYCFVIQKLRFIIKWCFQKKGEGESKISYHELRKSLSLCSHF
jgi:hypothetical protein